MKKILAAAFAALMLCALPSQSLAATRVMVYAGQNPDTNETNIAPRFQRLADGTFMRDVLSTLGTSGAWSNLLITPGSGLYVTVNPNVSSQLGAVYQIVSDDSTAVPPPPGQSPNQIPSDNTKIVVQALQSAPSGTLGPLNAPGGGGNAIYYLVESQLGSADGAYQSMLFVSSSGLTSYQNVNTQRQDTIAYQIKAGSASTADCSSTFPTAPTVDSGWISIGLVCIAHGVTQVLNGMISMSSGTNFTGSSFSQVSFGGTYASNGGAYPSSLSTSANGGCDLSDMLGLVVNNPSSTNNGNHVVSVNQAGDLGVCGSKLHIFNQNSNSTPAVIVVDTPVDSGTATDEQLFPASGNVGETTSGSCGPLSICAVGTMKTICNSAGSVNAALISIYDSTTPASSKYLVAQQQWANPGVTIQPVNVDASHTVAGSDLINFHYVCF